MGKDYLVAHIRVHDKKGFQKFKEMSGPMISEYGGKVLACNPNSEVREGGYSGVAIVIKLESIEAIQKFYESDKYTEAKAVR